ncbi:helix-turn-helix domain-containing protein [Paenibacillus sp. LjRoot56]|uniref:helix-turn-helix domain-containing protein n=1 Tax=Paenibacillus sp. LjRoot56 TaxID=3342333 RepID=UPI003ECEB334
MQDLGEVLKGLRGKLSLRDAAKRSGLSYSYISSLEKGKHPRTGAPINPTPDILKSLSNAYNYPYEELMKKAGYLSDEGEEQEEKKELNHEAVNEFIDYLNDPKSVINGHPIPQSFIDDMTRYVDTLTAMGKLKGKP